ncbi:MAG: HEAT repeat domain-containing protein [SAR202 cluster bacterium]|nr:HEAT repeat domain-containing protein [SAR202 cluster bacterium]
MSQIPNLIKEIGDENRPLEHQRLIELSGLDTTEKTELVSSWPNISNDRRMDIVVQLSEIAEQELGFDFSTVFFISLRDQDARIREKAIMALWEVDDRSIIRLLTELLINDPTANVRAAAATSLGKFAMMAQEGKLIPKDHRHIRSSLLTAVQAADETFEVRRRALESVAVFGEPEVDDLIRKTHDSDEVKLKQSAIFAMGRSSEERWLPTVIRDLSDTSPAIRFEAVNAMALIGNQDAVANLIKLLDDEDPEVQIATARALGNIGGNVAKQALSDCLENADEALEEAASEALNEITFDEDPLAIRFDTQL